jgi:hypothetical protein
VTNRVENDPSIPNPEHGDYAPIDAWNACDWRRLSLIEQRVASSAGSPNCDDSLVNRQTVHAIPRAPEAIAALVVKVKPLTRSLRDRSARRRRLACHVLLVSDRGRSAAWRTKGTWRQSAAPARRSHPEGAATKWRSGAAA